MAASTLNIAGRASPEHPPPPPASPPRSHSPTNNPVVVVGKAVKKMSSNFFRAGHDATVVHKQHLRPSLPKAQTAPPSPPPSSVPASPSTPSTPGGRSGQSSPGKDSTGKTSVASKASSSSKDTVVLGAEKKGAHSGVALTAAAAGGSASRPLLGDLGTIRETPLDVACPTVVTVERAAAAKIYLETHFNELLSGPTPRSLRRRCLEGDLYHAGAALSTLGRDHRRRAFYDAETEHLREVRLLKTRSIRALCPQRRQEASAHGTDCRATESDYDMIKVLGKGSFGVVRLVREREPVENGVNSPNHRRELFAMKVIRKSDMLRSSQEGHLRAERDFLVASEGSRWYVSAFRS